MALIGFWTPSRARQTVMLLVIGVALYLLVPPLYWQLVRGYADGAVACPPCLCQCVSKTADDLISELKNISNAGCATNDPDLRREFRKGTGDLLAEELKLQEIVSEESQQRADAVLLDARKLASHYQKEAEKCNIAMETSEETREKAEAELQIQRKLSTEWEERARLLGWKDEEDAFHKNKNTWEKNQSNMALLKNEASSTRSRRIQLSSKRRNKQRIL